MSDEIFGQCVTLIGHASIQKDLLAAPIPTGDDVNKALQELIADGTVAKIIAKYINAD